MRLKLTLSAALASLLFAAPVFAGQDCPQGASASERREGRMNRRHARMEQRLSRAVENGRLTREQADQFLAEGKQLREELRTQREASGGKLTDAQKEQFRQRKQALREKMRTALGATANQRL